MQAKVKWTGIQPAKYNENIIQLSIGFEVEGEEKLQYLNLPIYGGSDGQARYAGAVLSNLLKQNSYEIEVVTNERGYPEVQVPREDDAGF